MCTPIGRYVLVRKAADGPGERPHHSPHQNDERIVARCSVPVDASGLCLQAACGTLGGSLLAADDDAVRSTAAASQDGSQ